MFSCTLISRRYPSESMKPESMQRPAERAVAHEHFMGHHCGLTNYLRIFCCPNPSVVVRVTCGQFARTNAKKHMKVTEIYSVAWYRAGY